MSETGSSAPFEESPSPAVVSGSGEGAAHDAPAFADPEPAPSPVPTPAPSGSPGKPRPRLAILIVCLVLALSGFALWRAAEQERLQREQQAADSRMRAAQMLELENARNLAEQIAREEKRLAAERQAAERAKRYLSQADFDKLAVEDYRFPSHELEGPRKEWLIGYRQADGSYALDVPGSCEDWSQHRDPDTLFQGYSWLSHPDHEPNALTVPAAALAPPRSRGLHLPARWKLVDESGARDIDVTSMARPLRANYAACLYLLTAPREPVKEGRIKVREEIDEILVLAHPDAPAGTPVLRRVTAPLAVLKEESDAQQRRVKIAQAHAILQAPQVKAALREAAREHPQLKAFEPDACQSFTATLEGMQSAAEFMICHFRQADESARMWTLTRAQNGGIVHASVVTFSDGIVLPKVVAIVDVDGDGIDELVVRQQLYEGSLYELVRIRDGKPESLGRSSYSGL